MIENRSNIEILSPAGSFQALKAVICAGADAVYASGQEFGARAYADNLSKEELLEAIDFVHLHEKRLYLTVNTLLKEAELNVKLYDYIRPLYEQGLDAVIVQDFGVLSFIRREFPDLSIHASTQMNITSSYGALFLKEMGCSRIVTARELSLKEIKKIYLDTNLEIESFVHGALCYSYSGQCLFSSILGQRSGNRGRCAQPCRLPYTLKSKNASHILSLKDLSTLEFLPEIAESGICSFKIEGRMKQAQYGAYVTNLYRKYADLFIEYGRENYHVLEEDKKLLSDLGNRSGFTKGYYYQQNGRDMITIKKPSHSKSNEIVLDEIKNRFLDGKLQEKIKGHLILSKELPAKIHLYYKGIETIVTGMPVEKASNQPLSEETVISKIKKTGNSPFQFYELTIEMDDDCFVSVSELNKLRRRALEDLEKNILCGTRRMIHENQQKPIKHSIDNIRKNTYNTEEQTLSVCVSSKEQLEVVSELPYVSRIYLDCGISRRNHLLEELKSIIINDNKKEYFIAMPAIFRESSSHWFEKNLDIIRKTNISGFLVRNYDELHFLREHDVSCETMILDSNVYAFNNTAIDSFMNMGIKAFTISPELNKNELKCYHLISGEMQIYGNLPLMVSAQCIQKTVDKCINQPVIHQLKDRYNKTFLIKNYCDDCYNVLYNSIPTILFHQAEELKKLEINHYRITFLNESKEEMLKILSLYHSTFLQGKKISPKEYHMEYTNGHFKRGVE